MYIVILLVWMFAGFCAGAFIYFKVGRKLDRNEISAVIISALLGGPLFLIVSVCIFYEKN